MDLKMRQKILVEFFFFVTKRAQRVGSRIGRRAPGESRSDGMLTCGRGAYMTVHRHSGRCSGRPATRVNCCCGPKALSSSERTLLAIATWKKEKGSCVYLVWTRSRSADSVMWLASSRQHVLGAPPSVPGFFTWQCAVKTFFLRSTFQPVDTSECTA